MLNILIYGLKKDGVLKIDKFDWLLKFYPRTEGLEEIQKLIKSLKLVDIETVSFKASSFLKK